MSEDVRAPFSAYQKRLFWFLSVACFFEGYDFFALSQVLPNLRRDFGLSETEGGWLVALVNVGTVLAYSMVGLADRLGRRRVLTITILGYALFTLLSGFAPNAPAFALLQLCARVFLIGEWAISMVIAAEEYPASRRGLVIGVIGASNGLGAIVCAGLVPVLLKSPFGWRTVYFVGVLPLLLLAYARRSLRETARFEAIQRTERPSIFAIWRTVHAGRVLQMASTWLFFYVCSQPAVFFWKEFAVAERGLTDAQVGGIVAVSALVSLPLSFAAGYFLDKVGRRIGGSVLLGLLALGVVIGYSAHARWQLAIGLTLATVGVSCSLTLLNTLTTELFPTEHRGIAFAWSNNLLGRIGYWAPSIFLGPLVGSFGWGPLLRATAVFPLISCALIWVFLPETRGRELERTAEVA